MMLIVNLLLLLFFGFILVKATDLLIINLKGLERGLKISVFAVTGLLVALATSLPELFVSLVSAVNHQPSLALGNIIGSNITDLSLIIGLATVIGGRVQVKGEFLKKDVYYAFLAGAAPMVLLFDKKLTRLDGLILLAIYLIYQLWVFREKPQKAAASTDKNFYYRFIRKLNHRQTQKEIAYLILAIVLLLFSAQMIVKLAINLARGLNLPILLIGLFLVAVGTSLPELAFEIKAVRLKQTAMIFGDLLGSVVANGTLIIGLVCLISPFKIEPFGQYLLATMAFVIIFSLFYLFIRTKKTLVRWEGAVLILIYLIFLLVEFV